MYLLDNMVHITIILIEKSEALLLHLFELLFSFSRFVIFDQIFIICIRWMKVEPIRKWFNGKLFMNMLYCSINHARFKEITIYTLCVCLYLCTKSFIISMSINYYLLKSTLTNTHVYGAEWYHIPIKCILYCDLTKTGTITDQWNCVKTQRAAYYKKKM